MNTRIFGMLLTGLALAMAVLILIEIIPPLGKADPGAQVSSQADPLLVDIDLSVIPPVFRSIVGAGNRLEIEGTSEPETVLTIHKNKQRLVQVKADAEGEWSSSVDVSGDENMALDVSLETPDGGRIWSDETIIRIPAPAGMTTPSGQNALILVTAPGGPSRIVQNPFKGDVSDGPLSMGPIDYDDSGGVIFSGRSQIPGRVRIYGNGEMIGETQISNAGRWFFIAADTVPEGPYAVGAELATSNGVLSRVDVSLTRMGKVDVSETSDIPQFRMSAQNWQVRRMLVGGGAQYTAVFNPASAVKP